MRAIDADRLKEDHPMGEIMGYRQCDIDSAPTIKDYISINDAMAVFNDFIKNYNYCWYVSSQGYMCEEAKTERRRLRKMLKDKAND